MLGLGTSNAEFTEFTEFTSVSVEPAGRVDNWTTPMSESPAKDFQQVGSLAIAVNPGQVGRHFKAAAKKEPA